MTTHRDRARRKTRNWQLGAGALLAAAVGLAMMPIAARLGPSEHRLPAALEAPVATGPRGSIAAGDVGQLAGLMQRIGGRVEVAPVAVNEETPAPVGEEVAVETAPAAPSGWAYKGFMAAPNFKAAVVVVNETQQVRMVEGQSFDGTKLVEIHRDHIKVDEGGTQRRIDLALRTGSGFPTDGPARPVAMRGVPGPGQPGYPNNGFNNGMNQNPAALAEAQRRMKAAISPPPVQPMNNPDDMAAKAREMLENMPPDRRDMMLKSVSDPSLDPQQRYNMLREMGLQPESTPEERVQFMEQMGVTAETDPKLYEQVKSGSIK